MNPDVEEAPVAADDSLVSLLGQMHDLREPPAVSMWPATPIWGVIGIILLALLLLLAWRWVRYRKANAYRREALALLQGIEPGLARGDRRALAELDQLLRRTALAAFPRREVAALTGAEWAEYLDRTATPGPEGGFRMLNGLLASAPYARQVPEFDGARLMRLARHWIRHHHA
ncbi:DUF4381 domain-containing protein [Paracoccus sp. MBLB3053]|uniref:DUF4381 domain-containing protein n=1 Tax=Paracoccus aurantius TaxID=3073814 RepID=A0ABU2HWD6_9RHOB|nr:DUF4381 domain-containing protein [Paracoccus sp. MBLB3053]MDS9469341.1 DUF4381 domain-containing protein [Paracoccus sp. MBLB3053]